MQLSDTIFKIKGKVQHYAWGGYSFIPQLLNQPNTENKPCAEYWLGAHPSAPSQIISGTISLAEFIQQQPAVVLGNNVNSHFHELPYLFKVLDVNDMLSIQVHPTKEEAVKGFEAEEAAGIPINAPNRNYKDKNHKPEVMVALSDFWLLHGFKNKAAVETMMQDVQELNVFLGLFRKDGYKGLYQFLMEMTQTDVDNTLLPLVQREIRRKKDNELNRNMPGWWVAKLYEQATSLTNLDRGIFSIYLFNIVYLKKGEAIFQGAGIPHAYLEGQNVELMANSDNVLRGGLTPKHIDVPELMKHTLFEAITPNVLTGNKKGNERNYPCPAKDFGISAIELEAGETYGALTTSVEILLVIEGAVLVKQNESLIVKKGEALAVIANQEYGITASGKTLLYKAFVPV
jgi:mannose-6-phosphate isomerase